MSDSANTFTSLKPDTKESYSDKKSFSKIKASMRKDWKKSDKSCACEKKEKCSCKN
jgi:hypothetical protein